VSGSHTNTALSRLPELLKPDLALIIVGFNPSIPAWRAGHYYANPRNEFYRLLYRHGLTNRLLTPSEDVLLPEVFQIGLTDLVPRPSVGVANIPAAEFRAASGETRKLVISLRPRLLCCNGNGVARHLLNLRGTANAPLSGDLEGIPVCVVPSSSGAACALARERDQAWAQLGRMVNALRGTLPMSL
jgi:TDG/mug DNA glycosylase family protein